MTHKLKLKRTPEEEAQHRLRKERRREKRKRAANHAPGSSKRAHLGTEQPPPRKWASSDEDEMEYGPQPAPSSSSHIPPPGPHRSHAYKTDYDALQAEIEEKMFREKMFDALGDDERLDGVEAQFNDFAQVPERWRTTSAKASFAYDDENLLKLDPRHMEEEEYAEWIRAGMYRKTHAEEYAEQQRKKAAHAARKEEEKERKAEAARLEKAAEEERRQRKKEKEYKRLDAAREVYEERWTKLLGSTGDNDRLRFDDVPWPIAAAQPVKRSHKATGVDDLTAEAIGTFLLEVGVDQKKERKDKLRETFLRFHPDKFEGRFMRRFEETEKARVQEAIGQVSRVLNSLMPNTT